MTELALVRHALPVSGRDPGLSERGHGEAAALGAWLARQGCNVLLSSPMRRAAETAQYVAAELALPIVTVDDLREWELTAGEPYDVIDELAVDDPRARAVTEGRYEDFVPDLDLEVFSQRVASCMNAIFDAYPVDRIVAVCHGGVINAYLAMLIGSPRVFWFNPDYSSVSRVKLLPSGVVVVRSVNEMCHLDCIPADQQAAPTAS
jgi:probable phosphoglycerate mutase